MPDKQARACQSQLLRKLCAIEKMETRSLTAAVGRWAGARSDRVALVDSGTVLSWGQWAARIGALVGVLRDRGVAPDARVAALGHSSHRFMESLYSAHRGAAELAAGLARAGGPGAGLRAGHPPC
jgi:acyl-CoA synthetase (AMP-forming)/AMP-acid ligase II